MSAALRLYHQIPRTSNQAFVTKGLLNVETISPAFICRHIFKNSAMLLFHHDRQNHPTVRGIPPPPVASVFPTVIFHSITNHSGVDKRLLASAHEIGPLQVPLLSCRSISYQTPRLQCYPVRR